MSHIPRLIPTARRCRCQGAVDARLLKQGAIALLVAVVLGLIVWSLIHWASGQSSKPRQQVARIAVLPDTPPPPPPPPPKEKPPEPQKDESKPQPVADNVPKPEAPQNEPIKMEGAAGNGPSAFQSGSVTQDYKGGAPVVGGATSRGGASLDRAAERLYLSSFRQALREELERNLPDEAEQMVAQFSLWVAADGRLQRWELAAAQPSDAAQREQLRVALERASSQMRLAPPEGLSQPMQFRLTLRAGG